MNVNLNTAADMIQSLTMKFPIIYDDTLFYS